MTPLTAAVLAAVAGTGLGQASGINDASSRIGGVVVIALVPVLIGATGGRSYGQRIVPRAPEVGCAQPSPAQEVTS